MASHPCLSRTTPFRVRHADDQHAVMQQRQHHAEQRALLAAVRRRSRGEHAGRLVDEGSRDPELARGIEEILEGRRHVAETRRAAEQQAVGFGEVGDLRVRRTIRRNRRVDGLAGCGDGRDRAQAGRRAGAFHAASCSTRERRGTAPAGVIQDQHGWGAHAMSSSTRSGGRPIAHRPHSRRWAAARREVAARETPGLAPRRRLRRRAPRIRARSYARGRAGGRAASRAVRAA